MGFQPLFHFNFSYSLLFLYCLASAAVAQKLQTILQRELGSATREHTSGCSPTHRNPLCCTNTFILKAHFVIVTFTTNVNKALLPSFTAVQ